MSPARRPAEPRPAERLRELARKVRRLSLVGRLDIEASFVERDELARALVRLAAELERATNNYEAARASYDLLVAGANESEIASARAQVEQAQATLDKAQAPATESDIAAAEAEVRRAESQLALLEAGTRAETIAAARSRVCAGRI